MKNYYEKYPYIKATNCGNEHCFIGYKEIAKELCEKLRQKEKAVLVIDCYPGVRINEIEDGIIKSIPASLIVNSDNDVFRDNSYVNNKIKDFMTDDRVFAIMTLLKLENFIDNVKLEVIREKIKNTSGIVVVYGVGASLVCDADLYVYADLARWEIQMRYRSGDIANWKHDNYKEDALKKYKRGYFFEWRAADTHKMNNFDKFDYILDTNAKDNPKMITAHSYQQGLKAALSSPFRVVPFFDPGVWGGQWLKEKFDLDENKENYAWGFDCVPEENSLLIKVGDHIVETPSINLVLRYPKKLLGEKVYARFGADFPIRVDFLDTVGGGNLSLQVHPNTDYIYRNFGMAFTQDESYYILDAKEDTDIYLGLKEGVNKDEFISDLNRGEKGELSFPAEKYINTFKTKKHDHYSIPAGTIHCSGKDTLVLEISASKYIFTFKLWDWDRVGMDGLPRPVHIEHGEKVIEYDWDTEWVKENLVNNFVPTAQGDGWREERTGLHELGFVETHRHWFSKPVTHDTKGAVNVLNLVEGSQCIVESPTNAFEPYVVNYAETFIVPAGIGKYTIRPYGKSEGKEIATIKIFVRET